MSYPQPPQWGPQGYYPPPAPPQKSNTGKTILLLLLGGMCVICTVPVVLSKPFRDGFREENERLNRVASGEREGSQPGPVDAGAMAPIGPTPRTRLRCADRSATNPNNNIPERGETARRTREMQRELRWRRANAEAVGDGWVTLRLTGMPACDNAALQRLLDNHDPNWAVAAETMCTANGFTRIECETRDGTRRTVVLDDICDCSQTGHWGGCRCIFEDAR